MCHLPYPNYTPSGIEWLGDLPQHWAVASLRHALTEPLSNGLFKKREHWGDGIKIVNVFDVYTKGDVINEPSLDRVACDDSELKKYSIQHGDFVFVRSSLKLDGIGKAASILNPTEPLVFECHLVRGRPDTKKLDPKFLCYFLNSGYSRQSLVSLSNQVTMTTLDQQKFKHLGVAIPPITEQQAIARFLDYKTAQIDALIAKKQTLLTKLAEKRTALISHAVTKGLDPSVPMKDSGVEWLGKIPAHWDVSKLSYATESMQTGPFGSQLHAEEYIEGGVPLINPVDISNGQIFDNPKITVGYDLAERLARHKLELGDIVIARRGEMGRAGLVRENNIGWLCGTGSLRARLKQAAMRPEFLLYQFSMKGVAEYLSLQSVGSTMDNLNTSILGRLPVILPPVHEQVEVVSYLHKICDALDRHVAKVNQAIASLYEYRAALITNAVTGKIDVRNFNMQGSANMETVNV